MAPIRPPHTLAHLALPTNPAARRRYFGLLGRARKARSAAQQRKLLALAASILSPVAGQGLLKSGEPETV
jgi:hypothetical protein